MDLSRFDELGETAPGELAAMYRQLHDELRRLCAADVKDWVAIDAVVVRLDEIQAGVKHAQKRGTDPQRF